MDRSFTESIVELRALIRRGERELILQHLEGLYQAYGNDALLFVISAAIDAGWIEEAWLLASAVIIVDPTKSAVLAQWIARHLRSRGWDFLAGVVEQVGDQSFLNHFGMSRSDLKCRWSTPVPSEDETF